MLQLPNVLNPITYAPIDNAMLFLASSSFCAIEIVSVAPRVKFLHSGYLRGSSKYLVIVINQGFVKLGEGYTVSKWFGPNVVEMKRNKRVSFTCNMRYLVKENLSASSMLENSLVLHFCKHRISQWKRGKLERCPPAIWKADLHIMKFPFQFG